MIGKSPQWHWLAIDGDGTEYTLFRTGRNSSAGSGSLAITIPGHLSNLTVYLEVGAQDGSGLFDSNLLTLNIN